MLKLKYGLYILSILSFLMLSGCVTTRQLPHGKPEVSKDKIYVRVLIYKDISHFELYGDSFKITNAKSLKSNIKKGRLDVYFKDNNRVFINGDIYSEPVIISSLKQDYKINGVNYEGNIHLFNNMVVLYLPLEDYVAGVVSSEMNDSWPLEALKAQAVLARTFVLYKMLRNRDKPYDIGITELYQLYRFSKKNNNVTRAVKQTYGIILMYNGEPIEAFYHSCSGGVTESAGEVFLTKLPYLVSIYDPYSRGCKDYHWSYALSSEKILIAAEKVLNKSFKSSKLKDVIVGQRTKSGRVKFFYLIFDDKKQVQIKGNDFRIAIGAKNLKSLLIDKIIKINEKGTVKFLFSGRGYGHGVGLSQWGAKYMAEHGFSYKSILNFYFRGVRFANCYRSNIAKMVK